MDGRQNQMKFRSWSPWRFSSSRRVFKRARAAHAMVLRCDFMIVKSENLVYHNGMEARLFMVKKEWDIRPAENKPLRAGDREVFRHM
jgi:hypothetical protein